MPMQAWICVTCGAQYTPSETPPASCPICDDDRQYVGRKGQQWTTLSQMTADGYRNTFQEQEPGLVGIGSAPHFAIGQRALLLQTPEGNVLWDCISLFDDDTAREVERRGGVHTIAFSHPHFYTSMIEWAGHFDTRIVIPEADRQWVMRPSDRITYWSGDTLPLPGGTTLVRLGGHFPGSSILHWPNGADGNGAVFTGDTIQIVADPRWVTFMYSYPNLIPLPASDVTRIAETATRYPFDRIYGGWFDRVTPTGGQQTVMASAARYVQALQHPLK